MDQFVTNTKTSITIDKTVYGSDTKLAGAELSIAPEANHKFAVISQKRLHQIQLHGLVRLVILGLLQVN